MVLLLSGCLLVCSYILCLLFDGMMVCSVVVLFCPSIVLFSSFLCGLLLLSVLTSSLVVFGLCVVSSDVLLSLVLFSVLVSLHCILFTPLFLLASISLSVVLVFFPSSLLLFSWGFSILFLLGYCLFVVMSVGTTPHSCFLLMLELFVVLSAMCTASVINLLRRFNSRFVALIRKSGFSPPWCSMACSTRGELIYPCSTAL